MTSPIPDSSGIYKITCTTNGKIYVGSALNLRQRCRDHFNTLRRNVHHNPNLQRAFNKYGEQSFIVEVLELVLVPDFLIVREQYWFQLLKPFGKRGFNVDRVAGSRLGWKATPETIERLRTSHIGKKLSDDALRKLSEATKGRKHRPESIEKMRLAKRGHTVSDEARAKISASKTGHTYAPEVYAGRMKSLIVTSPDGIKYEVVGVKQFCKEHNLDTSSLMRVAQGNYSHHKGWKACFPESPSV